MTTFTKTTDLDADAQRVYDWHAAPGALPRLSPPWEPMQLVQRTGGIQDGARMIARIGPGPFKLTWIADHREHIPGRQFVDEQTRGPFRRWVHTHRFIPLTDTRAQMRDEVDYQLPLGALGELVAGGYVRHRIARMFDFRHLRLQRDLALHADYADRPRLRVAITGASGLLGTALHGLLDTGGHQVITLVRRPSSDPNQLRWDPTTGQIDADKLEGIDALIHLAGANVADGRWTPDRKQNILQSRTQGTSLIANTLKQLKNPPKVVISASAIGYYGHREDGPITEREPVGQGFLAEVCQAWEEATAPLRDTNIRLVNTRIGVVLTPEGGALGTMLPAFQLGGGGPVGSGQQWFPWISLDDTLQVFYRALFDDRFRGPINLVAPNPVRQRDFARTLGAVLRRPAFFPLPAAAVRALFGEMGQRVLLEGAQVVPSRLLALDFPFYHAHLEAALRECLGKG